MLKRMSPILPPLIVALLAVPVDLPAQQEVSRASEAPELGVAILVNDNTVEVRRFVERMTTIPSDVPSVKIELKAGSIEIPSAKRLVSVEEMHIARFDLREVAARYVDGRHIPYKEFVKTLARPTPVVLVTRDRSCDPIFTRLFKPDAIVLHLLQRPTPSALAPTTLEPESPTPPTR